MTGSDPAVRRDWADFTARLAAALAAMPEETYIVLVASAPTDRNRFVQFAFGDVGLLAESVGQAYLHNGETLSPAEVDLLAVLGWDPPGDVDGDWNGNFHRTWSPPVPFADVAAMAVATLREVHGAAEPGGLRFVAGAFSCAAFAPPDLGLEPMEPPQDHDPSTVTLRDVRDERGVRSLQASLRPDGGLEITGQDLGRGVEDAFGAGLTEYEWAWSVGPGDLPALVAALGGDPGEDALAVLGRWSVAAGGADPGDAIREAGIPIAFWNRVGD